MIGGGWGIMEKLKQMIEEYGRIVIMLYFGIFFLSFCFLSNTLSRAILPMPDGSLNVYMYHLFSQSPSLVSLIKSTVLGSEVLRS